LNRRPDLPKEDEEVWEEIFDVHMMELVRRAWDAEDWEKLMSRSMERFRPPEVCAMRTVFFGAA
jgi:hypothetical protein